MDCINRVRHLKNLRKKVLTNELALVNVLSLTEIKLPRKVLRLKRLNQYRQAS